MISTRKRIVEILQEGQIKGRRRGMAQRVWYKLKEESLEGELSYA